ncbi:MAG: glutathione S-transferase family protein [Rubrivivax sp.]|nr:glutathione S-transferase family protein [Rubrivivax sp.]
MTLQLVIGNKNYSSWSMRPWVLMTQLGIAFDEVKLRLDFAENSAFRQAVAGYSPARTVPVLVSDGFAVWDTLAIVEFLHEEFPDHGVWPTAARHRARARSLCAEMHAGFGDLRQHCPMNIEAALPDIGRTVWAGQEGVRRDLARIEQMWTDALQTSGGPMLFGRFSAADAYFAPVCMRLRCYALPISAPVRAYVERVTALPGVARWIADAMAEADFLDFEEPYRSARSP